MWHLMRFQPTLPARGATILINPAARKEIFQPTLPARGATCAESALDPTKLISTHAPRTGSDQCLGICAVNRRYFNPRSPHGARLQRDYHGALDIVFQPTLPARGATYA